MNDDELRGALERRARSAQFRADELLPGVRGRIGVRPQPARVARWAPLAGLAAAAVIVVALVIVFPGRGTGSPASASSPNESGPARIECADLDEPGVSIAWAGHPTIVDSTGLIASCARIEVDDLPLGASNPNGDLTKLDIVWAGPGCDVDPLFEFSELTTGTAARAYTMDGSILAHRCTAPSGENAMRVELRSPVDADGMPVRVGGFTWPPDSGPTPTAVPLGDRLDCGNDGTLIDATGQVESCRLDTVIDFQKPMGLTRTANEITASWVGAMCQPIVGASFQGSGDGYELAITAQSPPYPSAASSCAGGPMDMTLTVTLRAPISGTVTATYFGQDLPILPTSSPSDEGPLACDRDPGLGPDVATVSVQDDSGLLVACTQNVANNGLSDDKVSNLTAARLLVQWEGSACTVPIPLTFSLTAGGYSLSGSRTCVLLAGRPYEIELQFAEAVDASSVTTDLNQGVTTASPIVPPSPLICADNMTLVDTTGLVHSCADAGDVDYHLQNPHVSIDPAEPSLVHVSWGQNDCTDAYDLQVSEGSVGGRAVVLINVTTRNGEGCDVHGPDAHSADITFDSPIDAQNISLVVDGYGIIDPTPCASGADLVDGGDGVDIYDETNLITGCTQNQPPDGATDGVRSVTDSSVAIQWQDRPCGVPIHLSFAATEGGFELTRPGTCLVTSPMTYEIVLQLSQPVSAQDVDASSLLP